MLPPIFQCPIVFGVSGKFIDEPELELELEALNFDQSFHLSILSFFPHFLSTRLDCVPSKNVPLAGLPVHPEHLVGGSPQLRVCVSVEPLGKKPYQCLTFVQSLNFDEHVTHSTSTSDKPMNFMDQKLDKPVCLS